MSTPPCRVDSLLSSALSLKATGDACLRSNNAGKAIAHYTKIPAYLTGLEPDAATQSMLALAGRTAEAAVTEPQQAAIRALLEATQSNLALAHWKLGNWDRVIHYASQLLATDPNHAKSLVRRGCALRHLRRFDESRADLTAAARLLPKDAGIRAELAALQQAEGIEEAKLRNQFANLFTRR